MKRISISDGIERELDIVERAILVLNAVKNHEPAGIFKLADITNVRYYKVRLSLRALEHEGVIKPTQKGATTTDEMSEFMMTLKAKLKDINKRITKLIDTIG